MKRGILLSLVFTIILITFVSAQSEEFSVRFHSFGKNATIPLKDYLGESKQYLVSQTTNVIVKIDQETGVATLIARPGWEGSEVVYFRTNESLLKLEGEEEIAKFLPAVPEILYLKKVREEELVRLFEGTIDPSILDLIKEIKREEIKKLSQEIEGRSKRIIINDEVDLKLEQGYVPTISMDFSLAGTQETEEKPIEEKALTIKLDNRIVLAILLIIAVIGFYFYRKHLITKKVEKQAKEIEDVIIKDLKQLSINKLSKLQKELDQRGGSDRFIRILREFFSKYFGVAYDFEFKYLMGRVKGSDISRHMKGEIKEFLEDVMKMVYYPTEKWTDVYGEGQIPKPALKKLIKRLRSIIRRL